MKKTLKIAKELIKKEIEWCVLNPGRAGMSRDYEDGFIEGLKQALYLLNAKAKERTEDDV